MVERQLDESAWKAFCTRRSIKDSLLLKALGQLARADKQGAAEVLDALDGIEKPLAALAREHKADKEVTKQLDAMRDAVENSRKEARKQAKDEQAKAEAEADEADTPVLLTTKMIPLLRELRKGGVQMHALIGTAGKNTAVLIMRRPISPARRKLLAEALGAAAGAKYFPASCLFEEGSLTFVVKSQAGGMAKRLKAALLRQTELRLKVRVRGEDPYYVDEENEENEDDTQEQAGAPQGPADVVPEPSPAEKSYIERLARLQQRLTQALGAQHPESGKLRAVSGFASEKAAARDFAVAGKALDMLEALLAAPIRPPVDTGQPRIDPAIAFKQRLGALAPRVRDAATAGAPGAQDARLKAGEAAMLARTRKFEQAQALLDQVEQLLEGHSAGRTAAGQTGGQQAAREAEAARGKGHVKPKPLGSAWRTSQARAQSEAERLVEAISNHPLVVFDPRADEIRARAPELLQQMPRFDGSLERALQNLAVAADAAAMQQGRELALAAVEDYLKAVSGNAVLRSMDDTFAGKASIFSEMHGALDGMRKLLQQH